MRQRHLLRRLETIRTSARRMIFGSIVPQLEMLSVLEPAASREGTPGTAVVEPSSLASRPVSVGFREPKLRSQLRDVMWTLLRGRPRNPHRRAQSRTRCCRGTGAQCLASRKRALPANVGLSPRPRLRGRPRGSDALHQCRNSQLFHLCSLRLGPFSQSRRSPSDCNLLLSVLHHPHIHFAPLLAGVIDRDARDDKCREQEQCDGVVGPTFHKGGAVLIHARRFAWSLGIFLEWKQQFRH